MNIAQPLLSRDKSEGKIPQKKTPEYFRACLSLAQGKKKAKKPDRALSDWWKINLGHSTVQLPWQLHAKCSRHALHQC